MVAPHLDRIRQAARDALGLHSLRAHVVILVVACILPMIAFSGFAVMHYANAQREANNRQILNTARALSAAMDVEFKGAEAALSALATSPALRDGNLREFYGQAARVAVDHEAWVVLVEPTGRVILNTRRSTEGAPRYLKSLDVAGLTATRTTQISNVFYGADPDHPQVSIYVPVIEPDGVPYALLMSYDLRELNRLLLEQDLPVGWWVTLIDREHRVILRNHDLGPHAGQPVEPPLIDLISKSGEAAYSGLSFEGTPVSVALTRSSYTGWTLAVFVPATDTTASLRTSFQEIGLAAAAMLVVGILLAGAVGKRLVVSLRRLSTEALALGRGMGVSPVRTGTTEIDEVLGALETTSALLLTRSRQRDEAERSLKESERRFRDIAETAADWFWESDSAHRFTYLSDAGGQVSAVIDTRELLGMTRWEYAGGDAERDETWRQHKATLDAHRPFRGFRYSVSNADGRRMHFCVNGKPLFDETGGFLGYRGTTTNETEVVEARHRAEQAEALLQDAIDSISEGFVIFDRNDRLVMCNERYHQIYGTTPSTLSPGITFEELLRTALANGRIREAVGREDLWGAERLRVHLAASGTFEQELSDDLTLLVTERRMRNGGIAGLRVDITALKRTQAALRKSEERLDRAQRIAHIGSWELDVATGDAFWSRELYRIRGLSPETFQPSTKAVDDYVHPDDQPAVRAWLGAFAAGRPPGAIEFQIRRPDGALRRVRVEGEPTTDDTGKLVKISGTMQDITEIHESERQRRLLEDQLHHSQKLESLGTLAGGIAHDLNNTLVPVIAMAKLGLRRSEPESPAWQNFELIHQAGLRARDLVKQVLAFSRKDTADRQQFRVHEVVEEALAMLRPTIPATIAIKREIQRVPPMTGDPGQIHQVIVNLMTNAVHAIGPKLGTITVGVGALPGGERGDPSLARLSVRDTGCGIDEATRQRIFDPFFTTKPVGEGSGLGLSVVHGIVTSHGGTIRVESAPGQGARFIVDLPLADAPAGAITETAVA
jgi:PAS domain S-box-containing protein